MFDCCGVCVVSCVAFFYSIDRRLFLIVCLTLFVVDRRLFMLLVVCWSASGV